METTSQLTGVIFFTIILLLQGAEEMFPLQHEQWKAGADESSLSSHAAWFCYLLQRTKMLPTQSIVLSSEIQYYPCPRLSCVHPSAESQNDSTTWAGGALRSSLSKLQLKAGQFWGQTRPLWA